MPNFDALHRRTDDEDAVALAFDLLLSGDDIRRQPLIERKKALQWVLRKAGNGIQYFEHGERDGEKMFASGLQGRAGRDRQQARDFDLQVRTSRTWIKVKNPKSPAATRAKDGTF